jgi:hypothetical protein
MGRTLSWRLCRTLDEKALNQAEKNRKEGRILYVKGAVTVKQKGGGVTPDVPGILADKKVDSPHQGGLSWS